MILEVGGEAVLRNCPPELIDRLIVSLRIEGPRVDETRRLLTQARIPQALISDLLDPVNPFDFGTTYRRVRESLKQGMEIGRLRQFSRKKLHSYCKRLTAGVMQSRGEEQFIDVSRNVPGGVAFPRALASCVLSLCRDIGDVEVRDIRDAGRRLECESSIMLRDYQSQPVEMAVKRNGLIVSPCGSGKTVMACEAIARIGRQAIIVLHQIDHAAQWAAEIKSLLGVECGIVGDNKRQWRQITLALPITLSRVEVPRGYGVLVFDEVHRSPPEVCREAVAGVRAFRRIGLTATPVREDGMTPVIQWIFGPILAEVPHEPLYEAGHLLRPRVEKVFLGDITGEEYAEIGVEPTEEPGAFITGLISLRRRKQRIVEHITAYMQERSCALALCARVEQCDDLADSLFAAGLRAYSYHSKTPRADRRRILSDTIAGRVDVITAVKIADENLNLKPLDTAFVCASLKSPRQTIQRIGRTMRPMPGKLQPLIVEFLDGAKIGSMPKMLIRQWRSRRRAYISIGAEV